MILSNEEIMAINQTAEFDSAIGYARAIEAKVLEKLEGKLRDGERYRWLRDNPWNGTEVENVINCHLYAVWDRVIDAAIKESK